jgi:hypothetical protein
VVKQETLQHSNDRPGCIQGDAIRHWAGNVGF